MTVTTKLALKAKPSEDSVWLGEKREKVTQDSVWLGGKKPNGATLGLLDHDHLHQHRVTLILI